MGRSCWQGRRFPPTPRFRGGGARSSCGRSPVIWSISGKIWWNVWSKKRRCLEAACAPSGIARVVSYASSPGSWSNTRGGMPELTPACGSGASTEARYSIEAASAGAGGDLLCQHFPLAFSVAGGIWLRPWLWEPVMGQRAFPVTAEFAGGAIRDAAEAKPDAGSGVLAAIQRPATTLASGWLLAREFARWRLPGSRFHSSKMSSVNPVFVWEEVDLEPRRLNLIVKKTLQTVEVLLNLCGGRDSGNAAGRQHRPYVFYNPARGDRFHDVKLGFEERGETGLAFRHHPAYLAAPVRLAPHAPRSGPCDRKGTAGTFDGDGDHAVPRIQTTKRSGGGG